MISTSKSPEKPSLYLSPEQCNAKWSSDMRMASVLMTMDTVEDWIFERNPEVEKAMQAMARVVEEHANQIKIGNVSHDMLIFMSYLSSSRAMHWLGVLDERFNGAGLRLVQRAVDLTNRNQEFTEGSLMVERLQIIRRIRSLNRIFSNPRMRLVMKALEEIQHDD